MSKQKIFISTGEISGDLHAAELMKALSEMGDYTFYGMGGTHMKALGLKGLKEDVSTLNTIGQLESLRFISRKLRHLKMALLILKERKISHLILVDNQGFNMILGAKAREMGIKVYYYIPPRVSVYGKWNAAKVADIAHYILPFLASDIELYQQHTSHVYYPGNPVVDKINEFTPKEDFIKELNISKGRKIISIFPGSRYQEIKKLVPVFFRTAKVLIEKYNYHILISLAHEDFRSSIEKELKRLKIKENVTILKDAAYDIMHVSEVNIMASGTATLESALMGKWPLICYRISRFTYMILKRLVTKQMIGLPNILLDEKVYPELLQKELNPQRLVQEVLLHINASPAQLKKKQKNYDKLKKVCGEPGVAQRAAAFIQEKIDGKNTGD